MAHIVCFSAFSIDQMLKVADVRGDVLSSVQRSPRGQPQTEYALLSLYLCWRRLFLGHSDKQPKARLSVGCTALYE